MNTKPLFPTLAVALLLMAALACNLPTGATPATSQPPTAVQVATLTNPAPAQVATSTNPVPTQTETPAGVAVSFSGVSFTIPTGLATGAGPQTVAAVEDQGGGPGWDVAPAHIQFSLDKYPLNGTMHKPAIYVYPAAGYEKVNAGAAESLKRLRALTSGAGMDVNNSTVPFVPFFNATQIFEAQAMPVKFANCSGIRMVTQYDQAFMQVNNYELIYHFEGLTSDGNYYIIAILPISQPTLAADDKFDSPVPAGGVPLKQDDPAAYYDAVSQSLNNATPESFAPSLTTLDALIQSIKVVKP